MNRPRAWALCCLFSLAAAGLSAETSGTDAPAVIKSVRTEVRGLPMDFYQQTDPFPGAQINVLFKVEMEFSGTGPIEVAEIRIHTPDSASWFTEEEPEWDGDNSQFIFSRELSDRDFDAQGHVFQMNNLVCEVLFKQGQCVSRKFSILPPGSRFSQGERYLVGDGYQGPRAWGMVPALAAAAIKDCYWKSGSLVVRFGAGDRRASDGYLCLYDDKGNSLINPVLQFLDENWRPTKALNKGVPLYVDGRLNEYQFNAAVLAEAGVDPRRVAFVRVMLEDGIQYKGSSARMLTTHKSVTPEFPVPRAP
jgi:hypothetical protein